MVLGAEESKATTEDMTMNAIATLYRNTTCAAGAALICVVCSMAFVESTSVVPGTQPEMIRIAHVSAPSWFGKPEPAVLVD
jgi:hypothetical protein